MGENDIISRQKKNGRLLNELKLARLIVKYNRIMLKLMFKENKSFIESYILSHSPSAEKLERLFKKASK